MDRYQFEHMLALQGDMIDMAIEEEGNKKGDEDGRDGVKEVYKSALNFCDLPLEMLWEILQSLDGDDLLTIARIHQNLLYATKQLKDKYFDYVKCVASAEWDSPYHTYTPKALEILLHGARVEEIYFDTDARPFDVDGLELSDLWFYGREQDDKAAILIEKLRPEFINFRNYESYRMTPRLCQALVTIPHLFLGDVGMEFLYFLPQWNGELLTCYLDISASHEESSRFFDAVRQLVDERKKGGSPFELDIYFKPPLLPHRLHANILGPEYLLAHRGLDASYGVLDNPAIYIDICPYSMDCHLS